MSFPNFIRHCLFLLFHSQFSTLYVQSLGRSFVELDALDRVDVIVERLVVCCCCCCDACINTEVSIHEVEALSIPVFDVADLLSEVFYQTWFRTFCLVVVYHSLPCSAIQE